MATKSYQARDIQVLEGLDAVRMRPGMYIGTTGPAGLHHILWEIVDNAIDEAANGFATRIDVSLNADGSATVEDNGRGIPVDLHPKLKVPGIVVVFTHLHAGGKFNNSNYSYSGGLHGVGASVTNALSKWLKAEVFKGSAKYDIAFESRYDEEQKKVLSGVLAQPLVRSRLKEPKNGTRISFLPDDKVFKETNFHYKAVLKRLKELAFLNKGITITLTDYREKDEDGNPLSVEFFYEGGLVDFVKYINETKNTEYDEPIFIEGEKDGVIVSCAMQHTDSFTENMFSYVNNIPTSEGGTHETGFKSAITKVFNDYARKSGALKDKDANLMGDDFREGLTTVLSIKMRNVQFEGQTKTKLGNPEARISVDSIISSKLAKMIETTKDRSSFDAIIKKAIGAAKVREAAKRAKDLTRQKNSIENSTLIGKLASCTGRKAEMNEVFIVEGDSAGGSAKQARDRYFQAILPLRGKPLNAEKKRLDQVLANEEIRTIISALGAGIGEDFNLDYLKYHKVVILSDADQDGAHIRAILLTFFFRYMKELITSGHVFIGMPPLYKVSNKNYCKYAYSDDDLKQYIQEAGKGYQIQRYKGLGEMNPEQLWETTMDPATRTLIQVNIEDAADAERLIVTLMGDSIDLRKAYISENANFNKQDLFAQMTDK